MAVWEIGLEKTLIQAISSETVLVGVLVQLFGKETRAKVTTAVSYHYQSLLLHYCTKSWKTANIPAQLNFARLPHAHY